MLTLLTIAVLGLTPPVGEVETTPVVPLVAPPVGPQPDVEPAVVVARLEARIRESKMISQLGDIYDRLGDRARRLRFATPYPRRNLITCLEIELLDRTAQCVRTVYKALQKDYDAYWGHDKNR